MNKTSDNVKAVKINFSAYSVTDKETGDVDIDATVSKFTEQLTTWTELQTKDQPALALAIEAIFAGVKPGTKFKKDAVITLALAKVGFTADNYDTLKERANIVMDNNPRYYSVLGAGGGFSTMSDSEYALFEQDGLNPAERSSAAKKAALELKKAAKASQ